MLEAVWPIAVFIGEFLIRLGLIVYILLRQRGHASTNLAWIIVILLIPLVGVVAYLLVGQVRLGTRRIRRHREILARLRESAEWSTASRLSIQPNIPVEYRPVATLAEGVADCAAVGGNTLELIGDTDVFIDRLIGDIDDAVEHCHIVSYIFLTDHVGRRVAAALQRAAERGVACRLLVDAVGSRSFMNSPLVREMRESGVQVVEALHANVVRMLFARVDLRNHRKIAVIDGAVSYMGSHNIADAAFAIKAKYAPWIDAAVRIRGPATRVLQMLFIEDWYLDTDESLEDVLEIEPPIEPNGVTTQVMGTGPNSFNEALRQLHLTAIHSAREELIITTPYFVPDEATIMALRTAGRRGVETTLIVPARNDSPLVAAASRSQYEVLLAAGVRIFEYQKGLLHAKTFTMDRSLALISSANLDRRSFDLNFEVSMLVYDSDFASELRFLQTSYLSDSTRVRRDRWLRRPWPMKLWQNAAGTLSPLL